VRVAVAVLAIVGIAASQAMLRKAQLAKAGRLPESSIVVLPESRLFFDVPNAAFGLVYYAFVLVTALAGTKLLFGIAAGASLVAAGTSIYLATRLIAQHLDCSRCWMAHVINALLCPLLVTATILAA
jgi:uncharacterized membrane protein